ncbi:MAG: L-seryl-tRNA(Sec) selenium transferase, partial [Gemmatimonadota bacterium]|nr:L-seryl-tRNA(Sec) selenium transferase [Gemmatimonadota bacterium]
PDAVLAGARARLERAARPGLRRVLNGTGVVLHTNLGRAPLGPDALERIRATGGGYVNLEYRLDAGTRGDRHDHCRDLLRSLTGSEDALVVNNTAAAVALTVAALAPGREVVVARGELVEIGGSFRLPEIVAAAGGTLREVGTTNRTRIADYRAATGPRTGLYLKVHPSNFRIEGFTQDASLVDLVALGRETGVLVAHDLGSGLLLPAAGGETADAPSPASSRAAGADLTMWSGDKLLGGPQAGILHGSAAAVTRLRAHPLLRALRVGRLTLAALEATLQLYLDPRRARARIPALAALEESVESVRERAEALRRALPEDVRRRAAVADLAALPGAGSLPGREIPSAGLRISGPATRLEAACRAATPPLIGRIRDGAFCVDARTLRGEDAALAAEVLARALRAVPAEGPERRGDA